jgi:hypothetical protein
MKTREATRSTAADPAAKPAARRAIFRPAKHLKGFSLRSREGEIGEVTDLYFDNLHWQVRYFVVRTGTWLKHRLVLLSPESIQAPEWSNRVLPTSLDREAIRRSPDWESDRPVSRQYEEVLRKHYSWPVYWGGVGAGGPFPIPPPLPAETDANAAEDLSDELEGDPHLFSVNAFVGHHVQATDGEIGHVDDLLIDDDRWIVRYLVVDTRNWWPGKKVILSPWWASGVDWPARRIDMDLKRAAIKSSPPYDPDAVMTVEASGELHDYYGRPRYPDDEEIADAILRNDNPNIP